LLTASATNTFLHVDQHGTPSVETDSAGVRLDRAIALPYGSPSDSLFREGPGFTGHQTDSATGLIYMQARYYDPVGQRFFSVDPLDVSATNGGNFSRYWYANNNPYGFVDPDGREQINLFNPRAAGGNEKILYENANKYRDVKGTYFVQSHGTMRGIYDQ